MISSSRFYSLRIKQKPKLLKLRSRLSWIHARVPWTGVPLLSRSRDPLCSSSTPRTTRYNPRRMFMFRLFRVILAFISNFPFGSFVFRQECNKPFVDSISIRFPKKKKKWKNFGRVEEREEKKFRKEEKWGEEFLKRGKI